MNLKKIFGLILIGLMLCLWIPASINAANYDIRLSDDDYFCVVHFFAENVNFDPQSGSLVCENGDFAYVRHREKNLTPIPAVRFESIKIIASWHVVTIKDLKSGETVKYRRSSETGKYELIQTK